MAIREVIFRAKRVDKGEWVYGVPTKDDFDATYIVQGLFECDEYKCTGADSFDVDENTIGQYTGLTDKNGTKVFEGDIVSILGGLKGTYTCVWEEHNFEYEFDNETMSFGLACVHSDYIKVIGNIHDNPELLKECEG